MTKISQSIGFIGAGTMAQALADGFVAAGIVAPNQILMSDVQVAMLNRAKNKGFQAFDTNQEVAKRSDCVFLAVKPQYVSNALNDFSNHMKNESLFVSIVAGLPIRRLREDISGRADFARVMLNTPCAVGKSASVFCMESNTYPWTKSLLRELLGSVGIVYEMPEVLFSAVTAVSGSGPVYVYTMIEAMMESGIKWGLPKHVALDLALQTIEGTATMVRSTGSHPAALKNDVCSPGGTSIDAVAALEKHGFRNSLMQAIEAAHRRAKELER